MKKAFTLIELLVVISIISLLASVVFSSLSSTRDGADIAATETELNQIRSAMFLYLNETNSLPGSSGINTIASPCSTTWTGVVDILQASNFLPAGNSFDTDPWGNPYCYDDNYKESNCSYDTPLFSVGPDGIRNTTWPQPAGTITFSNDDIGLVISEPQC